MKGLSCFEQWNVDFGVYILVFLIIICFQHSQLCLEMYQKQILQVSN